MVLILILSIIALMLIGFLILAFSVGGSMIVIIFGDVIVCIVFIVLLIRWICKRRNR